MSLQDKSREISLALIKVAVSARRSEFRQRLEGLAFDLLESSGLGDYAKAVSIIEALKIMVEFGKTIYEIEPMNARIILDELHYFNSAIRQIAGLEAKKYELPDIKDIFSKENLLPKEAIKNKEIKVSNNPAIQIKDNIINELLNNDLSEIKSDSDNSAIRQSAIIELIRQFGNRQVQLKDVLGGFPDLSERTIRYDLQKLCREGLIERVGSGGPGTYYKIKELV